MSYVKTMVEINSTESVALHYPILKSSSTPNRKHEFFSSNSHTYNRKSNSPRLEPCETPETAIILDLTY